MSSMNWRVALPVAAGAYVACYQIAAEDHRQRRLFLAVVGAATIGVATAFMLRPRQLPSAGAPDGGWRAPVTNLDAWRRAS
jgi:hypothetical protein